MRPCVIVRKGEEPCYGCNSHDDKRMYCLLVPPEDNPGKCIVKCGRNTDYSCKAEELISYAYDVIPSNLMRPPVKAFVPAVNLHGDESAVSYTVQADLDLDGGITDIIADHVRIEERAVYEDKRADQKD